MSYFTHLLEAFSGFSQAAGPVVVTALWQGAVLACGLAVCLRIAPKVSAAHRFGIWAAGFAVVMLLPVLSILMGMFSEGGSFAGAVPSSSGPLLRLDMRWSLVIGALWIAASIARAADLGIHSQRLRNLWKTAKPVEFVFSRAPHSEGPAGPPFEICTTDKLDRPSVIGFFAPRILIPEWLYARLTPEELEQVVLHESEHLRRHDDWTNLLQKLCLVLFPLNPALAWMERRLCREREMACDDGVVRATQAPQAYAACLASLAERGLERRGQIVSGALSLGAWQRRPELVDRVHRILRRTPGLNPLAATALVGAMGCGLAFGSVEFARCPQLVAFVPVARVTAHRDLAAGLEDARFTDARFVEDRGKVDGFRAVDAVAHVPVATKRLDIAAAGNAGPSTSVAAATFAQDDSKRGAHENGKARVVKTAADSGDGSLNGEEKPAQQWIVFTAWEQVESSDAGQGSKQNTGLRQDYDSSATIQQTSSDGKTQGGDTDSNANGKIIFTQLIFRIYQTNPISANPATAGANSDSTSTTDQPALVPLRDGWFVFQL